MNSIDVRRARMTADIAKPLFHRTESFLKVRAGNCAGGEGRSNETLQYVDFRRLHPQITQMYADSLYYS